MLDAINRFYSRITKSVDSIAFYIKKVLHMVFIGKLAFKKNAKQARDI